MSSIVTFCPACGRALDQEQDAFCPQCAPLTYQPPAPGAGSKWLDLLWALVVWGISGGFLLALEYAYRGVLLWTGRPLPKMEFTLPVVIFSLVLTLVMHAAALAASWMAVTRFGRRPFWQSLGWEWRPQFKWVHAVALAFLMLGVSFLSEKVLPHGETDFEKLLKLGMSVRVLVAILAVATAPLVEEIVYRGLLYSSLERIGGKVAGVVAVTLFFALVHVPQYWGSVAAITAIVSLSLVLTLLRAWTGKLLPCVATHLVYNGVQVVALLVAPDNMDSLMDKNRTQAAFVVVLQSLGLG